MTNGMILPLWAEILVSLLLVAGGLLTLVGCLGLWRFPDFYQRMHGPTLGATMGMVFILLASMLYFSMTAEGAALHELLIAALLTLTVPATTLMLARAALYRHRRTSGDVPMRGEGPKDRPVSFERDDISDRTESADDDPGNDEPPAGDAGTRP
ncbi:MAG: monovalent cation/H(+) antiporter subunit G [Pigmentiphaga sp.]|uniref:monovalent cation/H(+) antiporter subunit G n=1 Tax=Pigmentiphaga sp. TaxID=1977564 RepID=UPI0029A85669|nr:monovalent cation/H(+) antiporter subunit G [Pigmentiphaga sp.]MDX3905479.1 monovalent cation/H(+) antiporter subunit G [Pigmentiphaga sp.]